MSTLVGNPVRMITGAIARVTGMYYGWNVAAVAFLSTGVSVGITGYAFGAFIEPLETEFGWTRTEINVAVALSFVSGLVAPIVGRLMDRYGARPVMVASLLLMSAGFLLRGVTAELWQFYLFSAIVSVGMPGATILPAGRLVGIWFPRKRGRMMGLVTAGNNFGGLTIVPLATAIIALAGWRWGFASLGFISLFLAVVVFLVVRENPPDSGQEGGQGTATRGGQLSGVTSREAFRSPSFYLITVGITFGAFTYSVILTQLIPHLENEGFNRGAAAGALTMMAAFGLVGKIIFGFVSESITARLSFVVSLSIQAAGLLLFIVAGGSGMVWAAVIVFGFGFGGMGALIPLTIAEAFGLRAFGSIMGMVSMAGILPQLAGPILAGVLFDATGNYTLAFAIIVGLYLVGAIALLTARSTPLSTPGSDAGATA